jgi:hypothetical protein
MHTNFFTCCTPLVALLLVATRAINRDMKDQKVQHIRQQDERSEKTIEIEIVVEELESRGYQRLCGELKPTRFDQSNLLEEKLCEQNFRTPFS